jgi:Rps23 Pro-64 3,4-dihydroxylase Tpa1-like proline 4-hydroxylase
VVTGTIRASALLRTSLVLSLLLLLCLPLCFAEGVPQRLRALGREMRKRPSAAADGTDGAGKRHATGEGSKKDLSSPLSPTVLEPGYVKQLKSDFEQTANKPYSHCVLKNFCDKDRLRAVHDELVNNLSANLKESDLFKVYQTCDLANLGRNGVLMDLAAKMPNLIALRDSLYSEDFKNMIKEVTGCGELNDNVDCATNLHTTGCHLLCHDDVIGTRKVSYIIYLTSPDDEWTAQDGGALEIYPSVSEGTPDIVPLKTVLPIFNTMAIFNVQPGVSFHSVQEVYSDKPRMSIQGWFHGPATDAFQQAKDRATVNQLISQSKSAAASGDDSAQTLPEMEVITPL